MARKELTTAEKWRKVDEIIEATNKRLAKNDKATLTPMEEYIKANFDK